MATPKKPRFLRWLLLIPIPALWCVASMMGGLEFLENKFVDWRFRFRGEIDAPVKIVYVDIDSRSIGDIGNLGWDRAFFAELGKALLDVGKVKAVGIDYLFSLKAKPQIADEKRFALGNRELARFLWSTRPVVVAASYASMDDRDINGVPITRKFPLPNTPLDTADRPELPEFWIDSAVGNPPLVGLIDTIDGGTRAVHLFAKTAERTYFHMAVELARLHWDLPPEAVSIQPEHLEFKRRDGLVLARVPLIRGQDAEVNWFSAWLSPERNLRISFSDALVYAQALSSEDEKERAISREFFEQFKDAIVLIGPVDPLLQDIAPTPLDIQPVPRVGIHGNLLKTIVSGIYLRRLSASGEVALILALTGAVCGLVVAGGRRGQLLKALAVLLLGGYVAAAFLLFARGHWVLPMAAPLGAAFSTSFAGLIWQLVVEEKQKSRIKGMFGAYVSPTLVNRMVESGEEPKLGGEEAQITAYFSDIVNFSTFAEQLTPTQLVELMNEYLTACTDIVTEQGGTLDKYIGDAVVAMFGAPVVLPDHAYRACMASQLVQVRLTELCQKWAREKDRWPASVAQMRTRIGLNTGAAVVGNMGSLTRFNYTMMGDNVNLAARMESGARNYGASTLVTEATKTAAELAGDRCVFRFIDRIVVKGRSQPAAIYEIMGLKGVLPQSSRDCLDLFNEGMEKYLKQDWDLALALFQRAAALESHQPTTDGDTNPSLLYVGRCQHMKIYPPGKNWDGLFVMTTK